MDLIALFPSDLGPWPVAGLMAVSFAGSLLTASIGLGGGLVVLAVMATILPAPAVIPVHGVIQLGSNLGRFAVMREAVHWPPVLPFAAGSALGVVLGGLLVVDLPAEALRLAVGLFVLWSVLARPPVWLGRLPVLTGFASSLLTMFVGATGPFVVTCVRVLGLERTGLVATSTALMSLQHGLKVAMFALLGFAYGPWLGLCAAMIGAGVLGTLLGRRILQRANEALFGRLLSAVLVVLGLRLVWTGWAG